jgi:N-6 DNA Methylase/Eco57I restriction-modification methylase
MSTRALAAYETVRTEGAILPADILARVGTGDQSLGGLDPASYHLAPPEKIGEATNRAWNRLKAAWANFQAAREKLPTGDVGTTATRERWLLPLFQLLDYGRLQTARAEEIGGKSYAISHAWQQTPIHLVGCNVDLDTRIQTAAGGLRSSPHSLLQELLNRGDSHLWGVLSNGLRLRLLRDNVSLTRQAFVEFDLEAMMSGEAYSDFVLLWLLLHQSRFEAERPELCQLEKWSQAARSEGVRVLEGLRDGVQKAIEALGQGFLAHPGNTALRGKLRSGVLDKQDYYRQLLRLVYRLIFLFVAEDRDLLLVPTADPVTQRRYRDYYATTRLRRLAAVRAGSRHSDLYSVLRLVMDKLSGDGCPELGLPALGSFLFSTHSLPDLNACELGNLHLLAAIRSLAVTQTSGSRRTVDYKNLGAEELGSVYESLLELYPELNAEIAIFELKVASGSERKKTGSYYTPTSLISCLLDSALNPVLEEAARKSEPEAAILKLKVVDPACGSGHFLIAAAHRIAKCLATLRTGEEEAPLDAQRHALRHVISHCIYGVDVNPMAVELCKVSLWMEALEPGKPLSFLEHRIQTGNSLLGATPRLLAEGIPDEAFKPIEGDDPEICREFKRINRDERDRQTRLFAATTEPWQQLGNFAASLVNLDTVSDDTIEGLREKENRYEAAVRSSGYLGGRLWADAWCAAFVWKKTREFNYPITEEVFRQIEHNPHAVDLWMRNEIQRLASQYQFFHWHLAFPDIFRVPQSDELPKVAEMGWTGGFDVVLGNPPWERITIREKEWFAEREPTIGGANTVARDSAIADLRESNPELYRLFGDEKRRASAEKLLARDSGLYPLCGQGDVNLYALFAEKAQSLLSSHGSSGLILPTGIATTKTTAPFFEHLATELKIVSILDFDNRGGAFPAVQGNVRFCLFTTSAAGRQQTFTAGSFLLSIQDLAIPGRLYHLSLDDLRAINPNTTGCPLFASERDAELVKHIYRAVPILTHSDATKTPWRVELGRMFHMGDDAHLFWNYEQLVDAGLKLVGNAFRDGPQLFLPLYESKLALQFNHRAATFRGVPPQRRFGTHPATVDVLQDELRNPMLYPLPRYWMSETPDEFWRHLPAHDLQHVSRCNRFGIRKPI